jgi:hypothetical protein
MFETYVLLKLAHVLLFAYWLGGDIGVFYSARFVRDHSLCLDGRRTALRIMTWIDMVPRYCLVLMLPVGYTLARQIGVVRLPDAFMAVLWLVALAWLGLVWAVHRRAGTPSGERLRRVDLGWRILLAAGLAFDAWQGFRGTGHLFADWISAKFLVFSAIMCCGILIRVRGRALAPALRALLAEGSTPEREAAVAGAAAAVRPWVFAIWGLLVLAAWIGIAKPDLG